MSRAKILKNETDEATKRIHGKQKLSNEVLKVLTFASGYHPITRGIFFSSDVSPEETKGKINIYLSLGKSQGTQWDTQCDIKSTKK